MDDKLMNVELDKAGLISLVRGTCPNYHIMEEILISQAGRYVGGFHDKWEWNDLNHFTEQQLKAIYDNCVWSWKEENIPAPTPREPLDPNRKIIQYTTDTGQKFWIDEEAQKTLQKLNDDFNKDMFYGDKNR